MVSRPVLYCRTLHCCILCIVNGHRDNHDLCQERTLTKYIWSHQAPRTQQRKPHNSSAEKPAAESTASTSCKTGPAVVTQQGTTSSQLQHHLDSPCPWTINFCSAVLAHCFALGHQIWKAGLSQGVHGTGIAGQGDASAAQHCAAGELHGQVFMLQA